MGPQINVIGSFFPSWMLCAAIGVVIAVIARQVFLRAGVDPSLGPRPLVYPSLALLVTLAPSVTWLSIHGHGVTRRSRERRGTPHRGPTHRASARRRRPD